MPAASNYDVDRLFETECAGRPGGSDLADAVPQCRCRRDARILEGANGRDLQRQQERLRICRAAQLRCQILGEQLIDDRPFLRLRKVTVDLGQRLAEARVGVPHVPPHARPLRAIAREQEGNREIAAERLAGLDVGRGLSAREMVGVKPDFLGGIAANHHAVLQVVA